MVQNFIKKIKWFTRWLNYLAIWLIWTSSNTSAQPSLSQKTNYYITQTSDSRMFIASTDGLNIFDGQDTKVYRPTTHHMYGSNIQSAFYEDSLHQVWFCTYRALHVYDPEKDDFDYYFVTDNNGDTLKHDYRVIGLHGNELWIHTERNLHVWDVIENKMVNSFPSPSSNVFKGLFDTDLQNLLLIGSDNLTHLKYIDDSLFTVFQKNELSGYVLAYDSTEQVFWTGGTDGHLRVYDLKTKKIQFDTLLSTGNISNLELVDSSTIACVTTNGIFYIERSNYNVISKETPTHPISKTKLENTNLLYLAPDKSTWVASDGDGVFNAKPAYQKFIHGAMLSDGTYPSITGIHAIKQDSFLLLTTRLNGIIICDRQGNTIKHIRDLPKADNFTVLSSLQIKNGDILFMSHAQLYRFDSKTFQIILLNNTNQPINPVYIPTMLELPNGKIIASIYDNRLYNIEVSENNYQLSPIGPKLKETPITNFHLLHGNQYILSGNEVVLYLVAFNHNYDNYTVLKELPIERGIKSIAYVNDTLAYLSNSGGIYSINPSDYSYSRLKSKFGELSQNIYSVQVDHAENLWLSTNSGIIKYKPTTSTSRVFTTMEGVQDEEFNTHAYHTLGDGTVIYGGVNGINIFHPDQITSSQDKAPIYISQYNINDETSIAFGQANFLTNINLPYDQNTISFDFHAIDYANPAATRLKYQLIGIDDRPITSYQSKIRVRYPNLPAGKYKLVITGANADQVWNKKSRQIDITISPPWWQTWWFRLLFITGFTVMIYLLTRYRYQQQLIKKDYKLREQKLLIEKKEALEKERSRIASEMHDDLGGGLTSISFLTRLLQPTDLKQTNAIKKIQDLSSKLVSDMSEIIWAMDNKQTSLNDLIAYVKRNISELISEYDLDLNLSREINQNIHLSATSKRNIYLIIKEAVHNTVKHADANRVDLRFKLNESQLEITIEDDGSGLPKELKHSGHGFINMEKRAKKLNGTLVLNSQNGLRINLILPTENIIQSHTI